MNISKLAIRRIIGTMVIVALLCGLGLFFLREQSIDMLPRVVYPQVMVRVSYEGASPEEIENSVTRRIESAVASAEDAIRVVSNVSEGTSRTNVYFDYRKDMEDALNDVRARLDRVYNSLPDGADRPIVSKMDPTQAAIMEVGFSSATRDEIEMNRWAERDLAEVFTGVPGLASVTVSGGKLREIKVIFDPQKLARYELSVDQIIRRLAEENVDLPGGYITIGDREFTVRLSARYRSLADIGQVIIVSREGVPIRLSQVAQVLDTSSDQRVMVRINQVPSVMMSFTKQPNANTVEVCAGIRNKLEEFKDKGIIPADMTVSIVNDQSYYISNSINSVATSLLYGAVLTIIVVYLFLGSFIRTLVVAMAIPISLSVTFFLMSMFKININMFSLGGLVLGVGMLLDNSIVMLENITRHQRTKHEDAITAAEEGSVEIGSAVAASTLTNLASVLPFVMVSGVAVLLFRDLIITISVAIIASLTTALTVVPAMTARLAKYSKKKERVNERITDGLAVIYQKALRFVLRFRWLVVLVLVLAGFLTYQSYKVSGSEFLPQIDDGRINMFIRLQQGTAIHITDAMVREIESKILESDPDIKTVYISVGGMWAGGGIAQFSNQARMSVQLVDMNLRKGSTDISLRKIQEIVNPYIGYHGAEIRLNKARLRGLRIGGTDEAVEIKIFGPDIERINEYANEVMARLATIPGMTNLNISLDLSRPEFQIILDRTKLGNFGLSATQVGETIRTTLTGSRASLFNDINYGQDFDIRVLYDRSKYRTAESVKNILITSPSGFAVRLGEVAQVRDAFGPVSIERENQSRVVRVLGDTQSGLSSGKAAEEAERVLKDMVLPLPYRMEIGGEAESMAESNSVLFAAAILGLFLVYGIMAVQFESLRDPFVIMFTVPFAIMGALLSLIVTQTSFSMVVFLGIIILIGVAVNNGIVMVDYFGQLRRQGKTVYEAVIEGSPTRLRPVLMTSLTTIVGLIPMSLGLGEGSEMLVPLGRAVMGGMMLAFLLTLFVIPSVYMIFNRGKIQ